MRAFNLLPVLLFVCVFCNAQNVNLEWNKKFNNKSEATDLKVKADSEGYIYLAGTFYGDSINGNDGVLTKLAPNKDSVFSVVLRGTSAGEDKVNGLAFDENDNSYVAGSFKTGGGNYTPGVVKVNNEGVLKWHYYATSYGENFNEAVKVIAVSSNEIYVCGTYFIDEGQTGVFIQKLDSSGTVEWNYNYANEGLNKIADFAIGTDNMVVLAGNKQVNESVYDAFMIKLDAEGEAICERMLSDVAGMDVFISAMAAGDGAYYMAGNTGDKDYFTIRLNGNGDLEWYATYDGEGLDDIATGVVCVNGNVAVCGTAETEEYSNGINKDIVVILYNQDGEQVWLQRFNSNNDGNDYATGIKVNAVNEDELLVCGMTSTEDQLNNAYILCYSADGEVIWSIGYNDEENRDNITSDFDVDFLGNVYVGMNSVNAENVKGELIKLNQPEKVIVVLKNFLKLITIGMLDASTNATVKAQVNKMCALTVDSFFHVSFKTLIDSCIANGYNLKQEMNEKIADYHSWDASNYVDYIFKRFWVMGNRYNVLLAIPHYSHFDTTALNDDAKLSYEYDETDYPIQCLNCAGGTIDKAGTESNVTWTILTTPRPHYYINGDPTVYLTSCSGVLYTAIGDRCRVCPPSTPGPIIEGQGSSTGHIEIEIKIGDFGLPGTDQCYYSYNTYPTFYDPNPMPTPVYARLSKVGDMPYYVPTYATLAADECYRLKKVQHPIYDREYNFAQLGLFGTSTQHISDEFAGTPLNPYTVVGDVLSLCYPDILFNGIGDHASRYALAHGIYKIDRPGSQQKPVYFAFPAAQGIWSGQGPDMGIFYGTTSSFSACSSGIPNLQIFEDYFTEQCDFCGIAPLALGLPISTIMGYLATTNYSAFYNYWSANAVTVGVRTGSANQTPSGTHNSGLSGVNIYDFTPANSNTCTTTGLTKIGELKVLSNGDYQTCKNLSTPVSPGTQITIKVIANYKTGQSVNDCKTVTLVANNDPGQPPADFTNIAVLIRGDIKDYNNSVDNYLVEIWQ